MIEAVSNTSSQTKDPFVIEIEATQVPKMLTLFQSNYKSMVHCLVLMEGRLVLVSPAYLK
jgi:hypothetical protein